MLYNACSPRDKGVRGVDLEQSKSAILERCYAKDNPRMGLKFPGFGDNTVSLPPSQPQARRGWYGAQHEAKRKRAKSEMLSHASALHLIRDSG